MKNTLADKLKKSFVYEEASRVGRVLRHSKRHLYSTLASLSILGAPLACGSPTQPNPNPTSQNISPVADFAVTPENGLAPLMANYNGLSSRDPDGSIVKWKWEYGDGVIDSTSGPTPTHMFAPGSYTSCLTVEDNKGATNRTCKQVTAVGSLTGQLEDVLTGQRISGEIIDYGIHKDTTDSNGEYSFPLQPSGTPLRINSSQFYNVTLPITTNGQNVKRDLQMIKRYEDPITREDLLTFMKNYMKDSRWSDSDLPVKVFIDNNVPSQEYREAVRQGIMSWDTAVNQHLPEGRKLTLAQIVPSDPNVGIKFEYNSVTPFFDPYLGNFQKGTIKMNSTQGSNGVVQTTAHEFGHALFGTKQIPFDHSPYSTHIMYMNNSGQNRTPSPFEGLVVATKYKLAKDAIGNYSK